MIKNSSEDRDRMKALYDAAPYSGVLSNSHVQSVPLLNHWINSASGHDSLALHHKAHILVAGCGAGSEAIMLAKHYPQAKIVGIDFSEKSIESAQTLAGKEKVKNIIFEVADLINPAWTSKYGAFDFILCHAVADYVESVSILMKNFAQALASEGVLFMTTNTPHHPAKRLRRAFSELGIPQESFQDTAEQRNMLQTMVELMGNNVGLGDLQNAPAAYLNIDIFAPIAHHLPIDEWCQHARDANLSFCGSMEAIYGLNQLSDEQLTPLFQLGRTALSKWMIELRQPVGMQLLFSRSKPVDVHFDSKEWLLSWRPKLHSVVGNLPPLQTEANNPMHLTLQFPGVPDLFIYSNAYDLEALRLCDGEKSLEKIIAEIGVKGDMMALKGTLFRAYHYGLLSNPIQTA